MAVVPRHALPRLRESRYRLHMCFWTDCARFDHGSYVVPHYAFVSVSVRSRKFLLGGGGGNESVFWSTILPEF